MSHERRVTVTCAPTESGWRCVVDADDGDSSGRHTVTVGRDDAERLAVAHDPRQVERLVDETFDFLLDREPRSSVLTTFDLAVVEGYFAGFEAEIARRLAP